jgi:hypothetical protein
MSDPKLMMSASLRINPRPFSFLPQGLDRHSLGSTTGQLSRQRSLSY